MRQVDSCLDASQIGEIMNNQFPKSMLYKMAKEVCGKEMLTDLDLDDKHKIGQRLLYMAYPYGVSTDISEQTSYGYGDLDNNGFFEFPIYPSDIKAMKEGKL
jgi:hypothetical protein